MLLHAHEMIHTEIVSCCKLLEDTAGMRRIAHSARHPELVGQPDNPFPLLWAVVGPQLPETALNVDVHTRLCTSGLLLRFGHDSVTGLQLCMCTVQSLKGSTDPGPVVERQHCCTCPPSAGLDHVQDGCGSCIAACSCIPHLSCRVQAVLVQLRAAAGAMLIL